MLIILFLVLISLLAGPHRRRQPAHVRPAEAQDGSQPGHPFGYDDQGCDVYTRMVYGARASVTVGVCATLGVALLGSVLGGLAGFFGGWLDAMLSRDHRHLLRHPGRARRPGLPVRGHQHTVWPVVGFMVLLGWPQIARIARGSVITAKQNDYVQAARALGAGQLADAAAARPPNAVAPVIVVATIALGTLHRAGGDAVLPRRRPQAADRLLGHRHLRRLRRTSATRRTCCSPAGALSLTVLAFIMLGDAVRDALDPKLR